MNIKVKITKSSKFDTYEQKYVATICVYIETDNNRNVPDILVNPNIKLLNTKLTPTWGTYVKDEETGIGYRRKCDYMYTFETIDDAIKWLDETEENVIETLRKIRRENERKMSITYEGSREYVI